MISMILSLLIWAQNTNQNFLYYQNPLNYRMSPSFNYPQKSSQQISREYLISLPPNIKNSDTKDQGFIQNVQIYNLYPKNYKFITKKGILLPILPSKTKIGYLNSNIIFLADQLLRNMDVDQGKYPVIVTTFVNLNNFKETSDLGRLLKENLIHELQVRGWKVVDINYMPKIKVNKNGEFVLTRDMRKLAKKYKVSSILVGTYAIVDNALIVNARVINAKNGIVISTGQFEIPLSFVDSLLKNSAIKPIEIMVTGE